MSSFKSKKSQPQHQPKTPATLSQQKNHRKPQAATTTGHTVTKNLLQQFNATSERQIISDSSDRDSVSEMRSYSRQSRMPQIQAKKSQYYEQLPKSYILAMNGLQLAVQQKQEETNDLKATNQKYLKTIDQLNQQKKQSVDQYLKISQQLSQARIQNKFFKENLDKVSQRERQLLQQKVLMEAEIIKLKQQVKEQVEEGQKARQQLQQLRTKNVSKQQKNTKGNEQNAKEVAQMTSQELFQALQREQQMREKDHQQIKILSQQAVLLSQKIVRNQEHIEQMSRPSAAPFNRSESCLVKGRSYSLKKEPLGSNDYQHTNKVSGSAAKSRFSNLKQPMEVPRQRRALVSQMRELMRGQKELVSLNYQMEMLEKGMTRGKKLPEEMQRVYSRLKRDIQKKEVEIKQFKRNIDGSQM